MQIQKGTLHSDKGCVYFRFQLTYLVQINETAMPLIWLKICAYILGHLFQCQQTHCFS